MARFLALVTAVLAAATLVSGQVTTFTGGYSGFSDAITSQQLVTPTRGVVITATLYYTDAATHTIRSVPVGGGLPSIVAGTVGVTGTADGTGTAASFNQPWGLCFTGTDMFVTEVGNHKARKVTTGGVVQTIVGTAAGTAGASGDAEGALGTGRLNGPKDCTIIGTNMYIADTANNKIRKTSTLGTDAVLSTLSGNTAGSSSSGDAVGNTAAGRYNLPAGICNDAANLIVADTGNNKLKSLLMDGTSALLGAAALTVAAGSETEITGANFINFNAPQGCMHTGTGTIALNTAVIQFADSGFNKVRQLTMTSATQGTTTTVAGPATAGATTTGDIVSATAANSRFLTPVAVIKSGANTIVFDGNRNIKQVVSASGAAATPSIIQAAITTNPNSAFNQPSGACADAANIYIVDRQNHVVRKFVKATGVSSVLAGSVGVAGDTEGTGSVARFNYPVACALDTTAATGLAATVYVSDSGNNKIRKIVASSGLVSTLAGPAAGTTTAGDAVGAPVSSANPTALFSNPRGIAMIGTSLYVADSGNNKIKKIDSTAAVTVLSGATFGTASSGDLPTTGSGAGSAARYLNPTGVCGDATDLYVVDQGNNRIKKITIADGTTAFFSGTGGAGADLAAAATATSFNAPTDCAFHTDVYVTDTGNNKIKKITTAGVATVFSGPAIGAITAGFVDDATTSTTVRYTAPWSIAVDNVATQSVDFIVADTGNNRIRRVSGGPTSTILGSAGVSAGFINGNHTITQFNQPSYAVQIGANLYVSDSSNHVIRKIDLNGTSTLVAGIAGTSGSADGALATGTLNTPQGLCTDGTDLYVADSGNNKIRKVVVSSGALSTVAGPAAGTSTAGSADGTGTAASFTAPQGLACNGTESIWVADGSNRIRKVTPAGVVTTPFGPATGVASGDALGTAAIPNTGALFNAPAGIARYVTGGHQYLVVADKSNNKIKLLNVTSGAVTVLAGPVPGTVTPGSSDTAPASFTTPVGVAIDESGNIYVADSGNHKVRKVTWAGVTTTLVGAGTAGVVNQAAAVSGVYTTATLSTPFGVAINQTTLFVTEHGNNDVRAVAAAATVVTTTTTVTNTTTTTITNTTTTTRTNTSTATSTNTTTPTATNSNATTSTTTAAPGASNAVAAAATAVVIAALAILA